LSTVSVASLYLKHGAMVQRRALSILQDEEGAKDVVQEVFLRLHRKKPSLEDRGIVSWIYVVTTRSCLQQIRNRKSREDLLKRNWGAEGVGGGGEDRALLWSALGLIPQQLAALAVYRFVDEMTVSEIAEVMRCSERKVSYLLQKLNRVTEKIKAKI